MSTFSELGVIEPIAAALADIGITEAFPIQQMCIPQALDGRDLIGQAKTGTGKTLGFGIPVLQRIVDPGSPEYLALPKTAQGSPQALIVVPTRELCVQVAGDLKAAAARLSTRILAVYGGRAYEPQVDALAKGVDVVVSTPGRLIDLANQRKLNLAHVRELVLDEADEMLDMGFLPDVERIVAKLPVTRQTMLFSATMPAQIVALGRRYMNQPTHIRVVNPDEDAALVDAIEQHVWRAHPLDKAELIAHVMQARDRGLSMIFTRTKRRAQAVADELADRGFAVAAVHGDLGQGAREQALRAFRNGKVDILVATDVAARGIDVDDVTHVINYECPDDEKTYLHRVGRTGRAGKSGVAITLVDWEDIARWQMINKALGLAFHDPVETYHNSEHVRTGLGIAEGVTGRLPRAARTRAGLAAEEVEDLGGTDAKRHHGSSRPEPHRERRSRNEAGAEPSARRARTRRRTRGGSSGAANPDATSAAPAAAPANDSTAGATGPAEPGAGAAARPRRRRRRRGTGTGGAESGRPESTGTDSPSSENQPE